MQVWVVEIDSLLTSMKKSDVGKGADSALGIFVSLLDCLCVLQNHKSYFGIFKVTDDIVLILIELMKKRA